MEHYGIPDMSISATEQGMRIYYKDESKGVLTILADQLEGGQFEHIAVSSDNTYSGVEYYATATNHDAQFNFSVPITQGNGDYSMLLAIAESFREENNEENSHVFGQVFGNNSFDKEIMLSNNDTSSSTDTTTPPSSHDLRVSSLGDEFHFGNKLETSSDYKLYKIVMKDNELFVDGDKVGTRACKSAGTCQHSQQHDSSRFYLLRKPGMAYSANRNIRFYSMSYWNHAVDFEVNDNDTNRPKKNSKTSITEQPLLLGIMIASVVIFLSIIAFFVWRKRRTLFPSRSRPSSSLNQ